MDPPVKIGDRNRHNPRLRPHAGRQPERPRLERPGRFLGPVARAFRAEDQIVAGPQIAAGRFEEPVAAHPALRFRLLDPVRFVGVDGDVAEAVVIVLVPVLGAAAVPHDADAAVAIAPVQNHGAHEMGIERELKIVGQRVVRVVLEVVENEDLPWRFRQIPLALDDVAHAAKRLAESARAQLPHVPRRHLRRRRDNGVIDAPQRLEELVLPLDLGEHVLAELRQRAFERVGAVGHRFKQAERVSQRQVAVEQVRQPVDRRVDAELRAALLQQVADGQPLLCETSRNEHRAGGPEVTGDEPQHPARERQPERGVAVECGRQAPRIDAVDGAVSRRPHRCLDRLDAGNAGQRGDGPGIGERP